MRHIRRQAAEWVALQADRSLTAEEHARLAEWRAADPRHHRAWQELTGTWVRLDRLAGLPHPLDRAADPDLLAPRPSAVCRWRPLALGAAALVLALAVTWPVLRVAPPPPAAGERHLHAGGQPAVSMLTDGTEVELNAGATAAVRYSAGERRVALTAGEAHFAVARDPARPFIVVAGGVSARAIGTAFLVRREGSEVVVAVTSGAVRATNRMGDAVELRAGQVARMGARVQVILPSAEELERLLSWQSYRLVFEGTPLAEVAARLTQQLQARGSPARVTLAEPELAAVAVSGRIRAGQLDDFLEGLSVGFGIGAERRPGGEIRLFRLRPDPAASPR